MELLVTIAILAILAAILFPVFTSVKRAAYQYNASSNIGQLGKAALMYTSDNDEMYMPAMYYDGSGFQTWFGRLTAANFYDPSQSMLRPYAGPKVIKDPTADGKAFMGDHSGYGYNWGYLGSDFYVTNDFRWYPQCQHPAALSDIEFPSDTVVFATSAFINVPWWPNGNGQTYDLGFVDPVGKRKENPNVHFRHIDPPRIDVVNKIVVSKGNALVTTVDGRMRPYKVNELKDRMFERGHVKTIELDWE